MLFYAGKGKHCLLSGSLYLTVNTTHEAADSLVHNKPHMARVTARFQLLQRLSSVCLTALFWRASRVWFFPHVLFMFVFGCVCLLCVYATKDPGCNKTSIYCSATFQHGSTWLSHMNAERTVCTVYIGHSLYEIRWDPEPVFAHKDNSGVRLKLHTGACITNQHES